MGAAGWTLAGDGDPAAAIELRRRLLEDLERGGELKTARVKAAMLRVPRHLFVPAHETLEMAYANRPLRIGRGQTISQPAVVALMTEALELSGTERVLEIGTGSGYQAAVLALLAREVYSIEIFAELARTSAARLAKLGFSNVHVQHGDGTRGWPELAPFDRVLVTAAGPELSPAWFEQLADDGILVAPVGGPAGQRLLRMRMRRGRTTTCEDLGWVSFVPILPGEDR